LIGVVTKISITEYTVRFRVSNAQNGELISTYSTDLRMSADYSWSRGSLADAKSNAGIK
jgi:hypothetical protein